MWSKVLIILGVFVLALALRSFRMPALRRLGAAAVLVATFLIGYFASGGEALVGIASASLWFVVPLGEIVFRVRRLRIPLDRPINGRFAPNREVFPDLAAMTRDVEGAGFSKVEDGGWNWDEVDQFMRLFYAPDSNMQACICLTEHGPMSIAHWGVTSRTKDGQVYTTWDYPFSASMVSAPGMHVNQLAEETEFAQCVVEHQRFLAEQGISESECLPVDPDDISVLLQSEMREQISHNLEKGVIALSGEGTYRYSWRGCAYLCGQCLVDMVRHA